MKRPNASAFWSLMLTLTVVDCGTKELVVDRLSPANTPHPVLGELLRFTLAYNRKAAMGFSLGQYSRLAFIVIAAGMIVGLALYYRKLSRDDGATAIALALIGGGAAGNMIDRLRSPRGVVDFIDIGVGNARFWTFNVADASVFCGALLLLFILTQRDRETGAAPLSG